MPHEGAKNTVGEETTSTRSKRTHSVPKENDRTWYRPYHRSRIEEAYLLFPNSTTWTHGESVSKPGIKGSTSVCCKRFFFLPGDACAQLHNVPRVSNRISQAGIGTDPSLSSTTIWKKWSRAKNSVRDMVTGPSPKEIRTVRKVREVTVAAG